MDVERSCVGGEVGDIGVTIARRWSARRATVTQLARAVTTAWPIVPADSAIRCTGPSEHTTAVMRVSRRTVKRIPAVAASPSVPMAVNELATRWASDWPPADVNPSVE